MKTKNLETLAALLLELITETNHPLARNLLAVVESKLDETEVVQLRKKLKEYENVNSTG